jgi:hypothetical protein
MVKLCASCLCSSEFLGGRIVFELCDQVHIRHIAGREIQAGSHTVSRAGRKCTTDVESAQLTFVAVFLSDVRTGDE